MKSGKSFRNACFSLIFLTVSAFVLAGTACGGRKNSSETAGAPETTYTVTFRQEGRKDVVRVVKAGDGLADIPRPDPIPGYSVDWDRADFSEIPGNIIVTAVQTANRYLITYDLGVNGYAVLKNRSTEVTFGESFVLEIPEYAGSAKFYGWYLADKNGEPTDRKVENGVYTYPEDITVVAGWQEWSDVVR